MSKPNDPIHDAAIARFTSRRIGLMLHCGLSALLERGEWVWNRERLDRNEYLSLLDKFVSEQFDAREICDLAQQMGATYIVFPTMHHDGFCLYDSKLTEFTSVRSPCGRDLVAEVFTEAKRRGLGISLYHSLNNWHSKPDAVDALESRDAYNAFIRATHERIEELVRKFSPIDVLWYDGWWPFNADQWQAQRMNDLVRSIQPHILFNGRNGLSGDFATPENHVSPPQPWRPWEAAMTLNRSWGYHRGDHRWRSPLDLIEMLSLCASENGNLLINVGLRGDGSIPGEAQDILARFGGWVRRHARAIFDTDEFRLDLREEFVDGRLTQRGDWSPHGPYTASGNSLFLWVIRWPGERFSIAGLNARVLRASLLATGAQLSFTQEPEVVRFHSLPQEDPDPICSVMEIECDSPPRLNLCGGMRTPSVRASRYDPCPSDILHV